MIAGTIYGAVVNDAAERALLADAFVEAPYRAAPAAPVLYIKPRNCLVPSGSTVMIAAELADVTVAATIGLVFDRDTRNVDLANAFDGVAAAALVLDLFEPVTSHYRPTVRQRCRDGFIPVGAMVPFNAALLDGEIVTRIDGVEAHRCSLQRAVRDAAMLIADVSSFMTLAAGDMLMLGVAHDAPTARAGQRLSVTAPGFAPLTIVLAEELL